MERMLKRRVDVTALLSRYRGAVMGLCALVILFFHCWVPTLNGFPVAQTVEALLKKNGYFCVDVFFFLSGMGLAYSLRKQRGVLRFYAKRLRRVYVPYLEMILLVAAFERWTIGDILLRAACAELFTAGVYAHLWFVSAILLVYLLYPLLHAALERTRRDMLLLAGLMAAIFAACLLLGGAIPPRYHGIFYRLPTFLLGVLFARAGQKRHIALRVWQGACLCLLLAAAYALGEWLSSRPGLWMFASMQLAAFSLLFAVGVSGLCALADTCRAAVFAPARGAVRLLGWCGQFTLELYGLQGLYWLLAGPLEGRLTYLQTNLVVMVALPVMSFLLVRLNGAIGRALAKTNA